jgi:alanine dehydrogenase
MIIGVPKEVKLQEHRVALLPSAVYQLIKRGHQVVVERSAGAGS